MSKELAKKMAREPVPYRDSIIKIVDAASCCDFEANRIPDEHLRERVRTAVHILHEVGMHYDAKHDFGLYVREEATL